MLLRRPRCTTVDVARAHASAGGCDLCDTVCPGKGKYKPGLLELCYPHRVPTEMRRPALLKRRVEVDQRAPLSLPAAVPCGPGTRDRAGRRCPLPRPPTLQIRRRRRRRCQRARACRRTPGQAAIRRRHPPRASAGARRRRRRSARSAAGPLPIALTGAVYVVPLLRRAEDGDGGWRPALVCGDMHEPAGSGGGGGGGFAESEDVGGDSGGRPGPGSPDRTGPPPGG